ncbi:isoprenylcysteine carboxylmethyltransferase family protein [Thiomicrorhabdus sp. Milos-T2]|uniref:methyltransferase family protein n=1 Tax=Thiomicrorhabdus sp. Milos-T2 TaxID=90814 RepID=UPI00069215F7|nr:isoprenylcysteine carboxylmethyltransferase family protein [Thiomicrorhabdus sp. Milos-T2]
MTKTKNPIISFGLVFLQFFLIALLLLELPLSFNMTILIIQGIAVFIGLWAIQSMHLGHFNIVPDPMPDIQLITHGPYQFIRHPMYFSIILFFFPLVILQLNWFALALYLSLCTTLLIKLTYEERLLTEKLNDYAEYQKKTKKLIPFIF